MGGFPVPLLILFCLLSGRAAKVRAKNAKIRPATNKQADEQNLTPPVRMIFTENPVVSAVRLMTNFRFLILLNTCFPEYSQILNNMCNYAK